jgi:hypothetical protein
MHTQEVSIEVPSPGARRATEEGSQNGWKKPERFSARQKTAVVLRLLRLAAGQEAMKTHPLDNHDRELGRLREKLGESTMAIELLREKIGRLETSRPLAHRRSRR